MRRLALAVITILLSASGAAGFARYINYQVESQIYRVACSLDTLQTHRDFYKEEGESEFPFLIRGTTLIAETLGLYEGEMIEKDRDDYLVDAAVLEVHNYGLQEILFTKIILNFQEKDMLFIGTNIPPGATVLIVERDGQQWTQENCIGYQGEATYETTVKTNALQIKEVDMGTLALTNPTAIPMEDIWLYYKNYLPEGEVYLGGITYVEKIPLIKPGETLMISPYRYASEYSKIIKTEIHG